MLSNIWVWDPGVKKAPDPGSGSATLPDCLALKYEQVPVNSAMQCYLMSVSDATYR
jgi:hypothetical protein